jgi:hypothetical protein
VDLNYRGRAHKLPRLDSKDFRLARSWRIHDIWLFLYIRDTGT